MHDSFSGQFSMGENVFIKIKMSISERKSIDINKAIAVEGVHAS